MSVASIRITPPPPPTAGGAAGPQRGVIAIAAAITVVSAAASFWFVRRSCCKKAADAVAADAAAGDDEADAWDTEEGAASSSPDPFAIVDPEVHRFNALRHLLRPRLQRVKNEIAELKTLHAQRVANPTAPLAGAAAVFRRLLAVDEELTRVMLDIDGCELTSDAMKRRRKGLLTVVAAMAADFAALKGGGDASTPYVPFSGQVATTGAGPPAIAA